MSTSEAFVYFYALIILYLFAGVVICLVVEFVKDEDGLSCREYIKQEAMKYEIYLTKKQLNREMWFIRIKLLFTWPVYVFT